MLLRVKAERLKREMTVEEVCEQTGIATSALRAVEGGRAFPYPLMILRLTALYQIPSEGLFHEFDAAREAMRVASQRNLAT